MNFSLPDVTDIKTSVDGRKVEGAYSVLLGELVVYYQGHSSSIKNPETNLRETAIQMLQDLARQNYYDIANVPRELPENIRIAAANYANSFDDEAPIRALIQSFGNSNIGTQAYRRISWFCVNALKLIVPCWKMMCDDNAPEQALAELNWWLHDRSHFVDWDTMCQPFSARRDGIKIADCDACRVEPIANALVSCANYLQTANLDSAIKTISEASWAQAEGCWPQDEKRSYEQWIVEVALPNAYLCQTAS